jgi:hypothetical protein
MVWSSLMDFDYFIYHKFINLADIIFFQIKQFKWCATNVWTIVHLDTHFSKFEYFNYDNVKLFKNKFPLQ